MTSHHHHLAQQMTNPLLEPPQVPNIAAAGEVPMPAVERLPGELGKLLELVDVALGHAQAAGVLFGSGARHALAGPLLDLSHRLGQAIDTAYRARRDHADDDARFVAHADQSAKDYATLEHAYERLSDRHLADDGADSVRALLGALNAIARGREGDPWPALGPWLRTTAVDALDAWHHRRTVGDRYDRHLPDPSAGELIVLEELQALEPLRRGDLAEVVADSTVELAARYLRRADPRPAQAETLPLEPDHTLERLTCQRPECGRPLSEHAAHHSPPDPGDLDDLVEGRFAVDTHGLYCPRPPA